MSEEKKSLNIQALT